MTKLSETITRHGRRPALLVLLLTLAGITGCASGARLPAGEVLHEPPARSVTRLDAGRTGFVITEPSAADAGQRAAFDAGLEALQENEFAAAIDHFTPVAEALPSLSAPHINLAIALSGSGRIEEAEAELQQALELVPGHPLASQVYGLLLRREGRFDEARTLYERSLELFPEYYPVRLNLGILCDLYLDDPACALAHYERFSAERPGEERVRIWIAELRSRQEHLAVQWGDER